MMIHLVSGFRCFNISPVSLFLYWNTFFIGGGGAHHSSSATLDTGTLSSPGGGGGLIILHLGHLILEHSLHRGGGGGLIILHLGHLILEHSLHRGGGGEPDHHTGGNSPGFRCIFTPSRYTFGNDTFFSALSWRLIY